MADQKFSIILTVDLSCCKCRDKMKKILCKYEGRWHIQSIAWDEKNNKITLTGPFCPHRVAKKLRKKVGKVIKETDFPDTCACECDPKPEPAPPPPKRNPEPEPEPAPPPPKRNPKPEPAPPPKPCYPVPYPVWPVCCCCSYCRGHGPCGCRGEPAGWYTPCSCGCGRGCGNPAPSYGGHCHDGCRIEFFCEEDSMCRPM